MMKRGRPRGATTHSGPASRCGRTRAAGRGPIREPYPRIFSHLSVYSLAFISRSSMKERTLLNHAWRDGTGRWGADKPRPKRGPRWQPGPTIENFQTHFFRVNKYGTGLIGQSLSLRREFIARAFAELGVGPSFPRAALKYFTRKATTFLDWEFCKRKLL